MYFCAGREDLTGCVSQLPITAKIPNSINLQRVEGLFWLSFGSLITFRPLEGGQHMLAAAPGIANLLILCMAHMQKKRGNVPMDWKTSH
jgi:hypothetical protein